MRKIKWCAIGDSFTYLNDHLDETGNRVKKGYLTRTIEKLPFKVELVNLGINGSATCDWVNRELVEADLYTVLLGTNDWFSRHTPIGTEQDFLTAKEGTILGNIGIIIKNIHRYNPEAKIIVMNPVERGDFVYLFDYSNNAHGSYMPENGVWLKDIAEKIVENVKGKNIFTLDLHELSGFNVEKAVYFKRVKKDGNYECLQYPEYTDILFNPVIEEYPYPISAARLTYDGLHPTDEGNEIIADLLAEEIEKIYKK